MAMRPDTFASPGALRLTLAFAVFLHHTTSFNLGMSAVLVFFVLSGYWVAAMWKNTYSKTTSAYFTYLVSRVWRVAPVFALCSAITWALLLWRGDAPRRLRRADASAFLQHHDPRLQRAAVPGEHSRLVAGRGNAVLSYRAGDHFSHFEKHLALADLPCRFGRRALARRLRHGRAFPFVFSESASRRRATT